MNEMKFKIHEANRKICGGSAGFLMLRAYFQPRFENCLTRCWNIQANSKSMLSLAASVLINVIYKCCYDKNDTYPFMNVGTAIH